MTGFGTVKNILRTTNGLEEGIWYEAVIRDHEAKESLWQLVVASYSVLRILI